MTDLRSRSSMTNLDTEEQNLLHSYEADEWRSIPDVARIRERYQQYAAATIDASIQLEIDLSLKDMRFLQAEALEEGVALNALVAMIVHKYAAGRLAEKV